MKTEHHSREPPKPAKQQNCITLNFNNMKTKHIFTALLALLSLNTFAQLDKKTWLVGGNASFSYTKSTPNQSNIFFNNTESKTLLLSVEPNVGYFIIDKLAIGIKLGATNAYSTNLNFQINQTQLSLSPFLRYYFLKKDKSYNLFFEPSYYKYTYKPLGMADGYALKLGHVFFLNSSVGFETSLSYQKINGIDNNSESLLLGFGFQLYLEKNKN